MTKTSSVLPEVCESLGQTAAAEVQDCNALDSSFTLWARTTTGMISPEVFEFGCLAATAAVHYFDAGPVHHAMGHDQYQQGLARGLRFSVPGSDS